MNPKIGRFYEGRPLAMIKLLQVLYDLGTGAGYDAVAWIEGNEMVFGRGEEGMSKGFMRIIPQVGGCFLCFPRGHMLFDPKKRGKGPPGSQTRVFVRDPADVDLYVRRMIDEAYCIDE